MSAYQDKLTAAMKDVDRLGRALNKTGGYVTTEGVTVETWRDMLARQQGEFEGALESQQSTFDSSLPSLIDDATALAVAASLASGGPLAFFSSYDNDDDLPKMTAALSGLADGIYEILRDETHGGAATRYTVTDHEATFQTTLESFDSGFNISAVDEYSDVPILIGRGAEGSNAQAQALANRFAYLGGDDGAGKIGFKMSADGAFARSLIDALSDSVTTKAFGAIGDGTSHPLSERFSTLMAAQAVYSFVTSLAQEIDWAATQAALNFAKLNTAGVRKVRATAGTYLLETIYVPEGVVFEGDGQIETSAKAATKFVQAKSGDVIRVEGHAASTRYFWYGKLREFSIIGNPSFASGYGIAFYDASGNTVTPQDTTLVEDIDIREMPSGGIVFPYGGLPLTVSRIKTLWNGGHGIEFIGGSFGHQAVNFIDISGDGNVGAALKLTSLDAYGSVVVINLKSEQRVNSSYGGGGGQQANALAISGSTANTAIRVYGGTHISSVPDGSNYVKPGDFCAITGSLPDIEFEGVQVRVRGTDTGTDPCLVSSYSGSVAIPYTLKSVRLSNVDRVDRTAIASVSRTFGNQDAYRLKSVEAPGDQIAGLTPCRSLYESDAGTDAKGWLEAASGGSLTRRTVNDSGTATIYETVNRSGGAATSIDWAVPLRAGVYTTTTLPPATSHANRLAAVSNPAAGKGRIVYSDGTNWRYVSDDSTV